jgi:hypothetical protein
MRSKDTRKKDCILMGRLWKSYSTDVLVNVRKSEVVRHEAAPPNGRSSYVQQHIMWEYFTSGHLSVNPRFDESYVVQQQAFESHILAANESNACF